MAGNRVTSFTIDDYRRLVTGLQARGYAAARLQDLRPDKADMYLRHDVDLCLERAAEMASVEAELGVRSTYFVLISTDLYNPASARSRRLLASINDAGHEIGLHFDVTQTQGEDPDEAADRECNILAALTGKPVETISFHRPARELLNLSRRFAGRRHTYEPDFFSNIAYVSDSNGGWHHGHPLNHPAVAARTAIQVLTHPIWWIGEGERNTVPLVRNFVETRARQLDDAVAGTITAYAQWRAAEAGSAPEER